MYTNRDIELFDKNIDGIKKKLKDREDKMLYPTLDQRKDMEDIIYDFIRVNKRKIYGGLAQNELISEKNPKDAFYDKNEQADIDFYSPEPIEDTIKLCNMFYERGYKNITGGEAEHIETYTVHVEFIKVCDISYCPSNIFHRIPFMEVDGIQYVAPSFMMIDMYRILTDPLISGSMRWEKTFPRIYLLQKHYPFNKATAKLPKLDVSIKLNDPNEKKNFTKSLSSVYNFIKNNTSVILHGIYVYNCLLEESGMLKKQGQKIYEYLPVTYYEMTSINYKEDAKTLYETIKNENQDIQLDIHLKEYYPFWMFFGYSCIIYYKDHPIAKIYDYNERCTPIKTITARKFVGKEVIQDEGKIQIGSYDFNFLNNLVLAFQNRVAKDNNTYQFHNIMTSHLIDLRNYYFAKTGKTMFSDTVFEQFIINCIGKAEFSKRKTFKRRKEKIEKNKPAVWRYNPESSVIEPVSAFRFANSSGNEINNVKNLKVTDVPQPSKNNADIVVEIDK